MKILILIFSMLLLIGCDRPPEQYIEKCLEYRTTVVMQYMCFGPGTGGTPANQHCSWRPWPETVCLQSVTSINPEYIAYQERQKLK